MIPLKRNEHMTGILQMCFIRDANEQSYRLPMGIQITYLFINIPKRTTHKSDVRGFVPLKLDSSLFIYCIRAYYLQVYEGEFEPSNIGGSPSVFWSLNPQEKPQSSILFDILLHNYR